MVIRPFFSSGLQNNLKTCIIRPYWPNSQNWPRDLEGDLDLTQGHKKLKMMHLSAGWLNHVDSCAAYASVIDKSRAFGKSQKLATFLLRPVTSSVTWKRNTAKKYAAMTCPMLWPAGMLCARMPIWITALSLSPHIPLKRRLSVRLGFVRLN